MKKNSFIFLNYILKKFLVNKKYYYYFNIKKFKFYEIKIYIFINNII